MIQTCEKAKIISLLLMAKCPKKRGIKKSKIEETLAILLLNNFFTTWYNPTIVNKPKTVFMKWYISTLNLIGTIWLNKAAKDQ